jgi:fatty-acyl-CoA synthase
MTETSPASVFIDPADALRKIGSTGKPLLHTEVRIVDAEGFYYIVDRWKDMYISGGENVYPAEIENVVYQLPQIAEAAVIGVPDPKWGESGVAVVVLKEGAELDQATLIAHCAERLAKFKVPARMHVMDVLPRNATGKVLKRELRTMIAGSDAPAIS